MHSAPLFCYARHMVPSDQRLLHSLSRTPFIDTAGLAEVLGEAHATVHRAPTDLLADGIAGRVSHGTPHLPSSLRYYLTAKGIGEGAKTLGFDMSSDFVRAYHSSREWLALLIRRMDAVASVNVIRYGIRWLRRLMHRGWGWLLPGPGLEPKPGLSVIHHAPTRSAVRARSSAELPTAIAHQTRARKVVRQTHDIRVVR